MLAASLWALGAWRLFHGFRRSGFDSVLGDYGDPRLLVFLNEHWLRVLRDGLPFASPAMYHPVAGTLGYSDGFLLYATFYVPMRVLGADPFLAYQLTLIALTALGFATSFWLLRHSLGVAAPLAAVAAFAFAFPPVLVPYVSWSQNLAFHFVPAILLLAIEAVRSVAAGRERRAGLLVGGAGALLALLFLTAFYTAWFSCLFLGVFVALFAASNRDRIRPFIEEHDRAAPRVALAGFAAFGLALLPFLVVYLPVAHDKGGFRFDEGLLRLHDAALPLARGDYAATLIEVVDGGATAGLVWVLIAGVAWHGLRLWQGHREAALPYRLALGLAVSIFAVSACVVRFGTASLWWVLWHAVPGASAIRDPSRMDLVTNGMAAMAFALLLQHVLDRAPRRGVAVAATGVVAALVLHGQLGPVPGAPGISRSEHRAMLTSIPPPPPSCRSFFVEGALPGTRLDNPHMLAMTDALWIGAHVRLATLNGYSAWPAPHWELGDPWNREPYLVKVAAWIDRHGLEAVCAFDLESRTWRTQP